MSKAAARTNHYADISEKAFTAQVIALLRWHKWRCAHFRPGMTKRGRWVTAVSGDGVGFPDIFALRHNRRLMCELKTATGKVTPDQSLWLAAAKDADIEIYIWRPADIEEIERILK